MDAFEIHDLQAITERIVDRLNRYYLFPQDIAAIEAIERGLQVRLMKN